MTKIYCEQCGTEIIEPQKYCTVCGSKISRKMRDELKRRKESPVIGIGLVIDKSGSMNGSEQEVMDSMNEFIQSQQKLPGQAELTIVEFSDTSNVVILKNDIHDIKAYRNYQTGGLTALNDGIGMIISKMKDYDKAIVGIITDGYENNSKEWTTSKIKEQIELYQEKGWKFKFLIQGLSETAAQHIVKSRGVKGPAMMFSGGQSGVKSVYKSMGSSATHYRSNNSTTYVDDEN